MKTRIFALVLALAMLLSCSALADAPGIQPLTDAEGATVSMLAMNSWYSTVDLSDAVLLNEIEKRANVEVEWNLIDPTIYADTVSPMLASGQDLPDIIQLPDTDSNMTYLSTGMFVKLDEYMEQMPNYKDFLEKNPDIKAALTAPDGHIYYVPQTASCSTAKSRTASSMAWNCTSACGMAPLPSGWSVPCGSWSPGGTVWPGGKYSNKHQHTLHHPDGAFFD